MIGSIIKFFLDNKIVTWLLLLIFIVWGLVTSPFDWEMGPLPRDPVAVDAIPDIGENQQIVYTQWSGRSPQDVEDQITYPLTSALLGIPGVKSVRSNSMFGFSSIYLIFDDDVEFYWSRSRVLEKLGTLSSDYLPQGVQPTLGPDATALGQIYWYTLEGKDADGNSTGGWDLHELRSAQDFYVRYGLSSAEGVSEVASIGGFVKEYQVNVQPEKMKAYNISLKQVLHAVKESNLDIGAQTLEMNLVEYYIRGIGYVKSVEDIENTVVKSTNEVPIYIKDIAKVNIGPATRRGILDKSGAPAVGGVVVARFGANPLEVINNVKAKIAELDVGMPTKTLANGTLSKVTIVPFYDRSTLIHETIGTLEEALSLEIIITIIVVILMLFDLKSSLLISSALPIAVLMCFIAMRYLGVDANIVALSGIAIAVGTMVDMGIVLAESIVLEMKLAEKGTALRETIYKATVAVSPAILTAVATTIVSFLPVFAMEAAEGKLFRPLAFTKTFALLASIVLTITVMPSVAEMLFKISRREKIKTYSINGLLLVLGLYLLFSSNAFLGMLALAFGIGGLLTLYVNEQKTEQVQLRFKWIKNCLYALLIVYLLANEWMPLGVSKSVFVNFVFVALIIGLLIGLFYLIMHYYERILRFFLRVRYFFIAGIVGLLTCGILIFHSTGEEFMPALDEGSFLLMPTSMPHAGMEVNEANLRMLDMAVTAIPEVEMVVGKAGRVESPLDPAPMSMYENMILYKSEYKKDANGRRQRFQTNDAGEYVRDAKQELIPDDDGQYFRQWRDHIKTPDDIWNEIVAASKLPGITSAPKLQPIETRLVMLQTGMRSPMGIKVTGSDLDSIQSFSIALEDMLKQVEGIKETTVFAERIVGKPYLLIELKREELGIYGLSIVDVQNQIQAALGGMVVTTTVEGRERYGIKVRYPRELRDDPEKIKAIYISTPSGEQIPLDKLVAINYDQGPQAIKSEDGFLLGYVLFDRDKDESEVEIVEKANAFLVDKIATGELVVPMGISFRFAGNYEQQVRANKRLLIVVPIALALIFLILYFQFKSVTTSLLVFLGVFVAFSGGFIMIWLYGQEWFMNVDLFGTNMRDLFQMKVLSLSVAVWVGFLALFGIATDDGVLVATFLKDSFKRNKPTTKEGIQSAVVEAGLRRVKPAMMTTATTILALLPVLSSSGKGADIMLPMAIPSFGGMLLNIVTMFTVPVLYCIWQEIKLKREMNTNKREEI